MTISIWRLSHLTLAISSAFFIIIASLTGVILAFESISNKLEPFAVINLKNISISQTLSVLEEKYDDVIQLEIDENNFVSLTIVNKNGSNEIFYVNPKTGEKVGEIIKRKKIYEFATNLHRSLFLKSTGRFLIGLASFLLSLIAITGIILITKRQGGINKFFSKVVKENFNQYYHVVIGKYALIPIVIISLTGVYLSLDRFSLLPRDTNLHENTSNLKNTDLDLFMTTKLDKVKKIEFPFSTDKEDYFLVNLKDKEIAIDQFKKNTISEKKQSISKLGFYYSSLLHTGDGSFIWSIILLLSCFSLFFFIFSGFYMALKRRKKREFIKNKIQGNNAEYIVLVGSETGGTIRFANAFKDALIKANKSVFVTELNKYSAYQNAKNIIIFTATYGDGDAPENADKFIKMVNLIQQNNSLKYTVLGFGSRQYPEFCKFAVLVDATLQIHSNFTPEMPLCKIDNQDIDSFKNWLNEWSLLNQVDLKITKGDVSEEADQDIKIKIVHKSKINIDNTFLIELEPVENIKFTSGDLLSISPNNETENRLYSIAKVDKKILLSVKKHEFGICSNYIHELKINDLISARIEKNKDFWLPKKAKEIILIANGTGIAPFLGMIQRTKNIKIHLFWGGRTKESFKIYEKYITNSLKSNSLTSFSPVYSQEKKEKVYVQDVLKNQSELISKTLIKKGVVLICGSLKMQKEVEEIIDVIAKEKLNSNIEKLKENNQIKTDCY